MGNFYYGIIIKSVSQVIVLLAPVSKLPITIMVIDFITDLGEMLHHNPPGIYLFKVNNGNSRTICETCSKLTIKTLE